MTRRDTTDLLLKTALNTNQANENENLKLNENSIIVLSIEVRY